MNKNTLIYAIGIIPLILIIFLIIAVSARNSNDYRDNNNEILNISNNEDITFNTDNNINKEDIGNNESEINIIKQYFKLINEENIPDALKLLSKKLVGIEEVQANSILQSYAVTYSDFEEVIINDIKYVEDFSSESNPIYMVTFRLKLKEGSNQLIYSEGINIRYFTLEKENNNWLILNISTSP